MLPLPVLEQVLVVQWRIISPESWDVLVRRHQTADAILDYLGRTPRFRRTAGDIPFLTTVQRDALVSGRTAALVISLGGSDWLLLREVGDVGGQGLVWAACPCDPAATVDRLVALKRPIPSSAAQVLPYLQREIDTLNRIGRHDHIAPLVVADRPTGTLATQLVDGLSLEDRVNRDRRLSVALTVRVGIHVCRALEALHAVGYIHKDIKPANVILAAGERAVLIDFGLAEDPTQTLPQAGGTPYYIAPEVLAGNSYDAKADVFSLAATLYRLLAGQPPHFHRCLNPRRFRASRAELDQLRFLYVDSALDCDIGEIRRDIPRPLADLLSRALSTAPFRRRELAEFYTELVGIAGRFAEADEIEQQLWMVLQLLLQTYHGVYGQATYTGNEWKEAGALRRDLEKKVGEVQALAGLKPDIRNWVGYDPALAVLPRTVKVLARVDALARPLGQFLDEAYPDPLQRGQSATELLNILFDRTLEEVRATCVAVVASAHDWRTVSHHYAG